MLAGEYPFSTRIRGQPIRAGAQLGGAVRRKKRRIGSSREYRWRHPKTASHPEFSREMDHSARRGGAGRSAARPWLQYCEARAYKY